MSRQKTFPSEYSQRPCISFDQFGVVCVEIRSYLLRTIGSLVVYRYLRVHAVAKCQSRPYVRLVGNIDTVVMTRCMYRDLTDIECDCEQN